MAQKQKNSYNVNFKLRAAVKPAEKMSKQAAAHQFGVEARYSMRKKVLHYVDPHPLQMYINYYT